MSGEKQTAERPVSFSSSSGTVTHDEDATLAPISPRDDEFKNLRSPDDMEIGGDEENMAVMPEQDQNAQPAQTSVRTAIVWMVINTLATIGIVFTNKAIFSDPSLKLAQLSFAAFHFAITWVTLYVMSQPRFAYFTPRRAAVRDMLPLSVTMSLNVILPNLSLAFSTVTFYQVARILLTPVVAIMNFVFYKKKLPREAILALIPACLGVGMVSYYDSLPSDNDRVKTTSNLGILFAFTGIFASSLYTVWIASYHRKLQMSSMQLLYNQAPLSALLLLYVIPFVDTFPEWTAVPISRWVMILMSGLLAALINISQFFIVAQTGPVSSTVVGHVKTCTIVALGWITSGRAIKDKSVLGVFIAIGGIIAYSIVMLRDNLKNARAARAVPQ